MTGLHRITTALGGAGLACCLICGLAFNAGDYAIGLAMLVCACACLLITAAVAP